MFLDCPAYLDTERAARCGLPAEVRCRFTMRSTDGPLEAAMIRCPAGHYFNGLIESLTWESKDTHDPGTAGVGSCAGGDSLQGSPDDREGRGGSAIRSFPTEPEPEGSRSNTSPAYYLGRPARLWITVMRPHRRSTAAHHAMATVTGGEEQTPSRPGGPATGARAETACVTPATTSLPVMQAPGDARRTADLRVSATSTAIELIPGRGVRPTAVYFRAGHLLLDSLPRLAAAAGPGACPRHRKPATPARRFSAR